MQHMLTTVDNPHDPFTDFKAWYLFDTVHGYHSSSLLAKFAFPSDGLSAEDLSLEIERAIDEIVAENVSGMHRKVSKEKETEDITV